MRAGISGTLMSDRSNAEMALGELRFYLIRVGEAVNDGARLYDVFDTMQETLDAGTAIFDSSFSEFCPWLAKKHPDVSPCGDILLLHRLEIVPLARGQRLGIAVLHRVIKDWSSGCSFAVMKPYPLQFDASAKKNEMWDRLELEAFPQNRTAAFKKLREYYGQLGFERIGRSEFFARALDRRQPSAADLNLRDSFAFPAELLRPVNTQHAVITPTSNSD